MATVSSIPTTKYSFLRFYSTSGITQTGTNPVTSFTCLEDDLGVTLTNAYEKSVVQSAPLLLESDSMQVTTNFTTAELASDVTFIAFFDDNKAFIAAPTVTINATLISGTVNNFTLEISRTTSRSGYMRIGIKTGSTVSFISNRIYLPKTSIKKGTVYLEYYTSGTHYGFPYNNLPARRNRVRVLANLASVEYPSEFTEYRSDINSSFYRSNIYLDRIVGIETYYFDRDMHEAMAVALATTNITMNGVNVVPASAYTPSFDKYRSISIGKVNLKESDFSSLNTNCVDITQTDNNFYFVSVVREGDWTDVVSGSNVLVQAGTSHTLTIGVGDIGTFTKFTKMDGTLLTTNTSYTFTVTCDTTIKAIY